MSISGGRHGILSRRSILLGAGTSALTMFGVQSRAGAEARLYRQPRDKAYPLYDEATANVIPPTGYRSRIALRGSIVRVVRNGVISRDKFRQLEQSNGKMPEELSTALEKPYDDPIRLTLENAFHYVNLLWPVGLSNYLDANKESPLAGPDLPNFASTGGSTLGLAPEGSVYFNKFPIVELKPEAEVLAVRVAKSTYRPCCNNSTFFQDCNHGSALFAVLQLGASQGLTEDQLYKEALAFNSFWFPDYYIRTALYFKIVCKTEWRDADARTIMAADFSAGGPWQQNVKTALDAIPDLIPQPPGGAKCGT